MRSPEVEHARQRSPKNHRNISISSSTIIAVSFPNAFVWRGSIVSRKQWLRATWRRGTPFLQKTAQGVPHLTFSVDAGERYGERHGDGMWADSIKL